MARWRPRPASRACPNRRCSTWPSPSLTRQGRTPLGAGNTRLVWSRTPLPALENLGDLHQAVAFRSIDRSRVLLNDSAPTDLEWADGNRAPAIRKLSGKLSGPSATTQSLAAAFDQHLAPSCRQPRTRADYWRAWLLVITWAVARKAVRLILPMSLDTLKALTWDLVCFAVPSSQVEMVWKAVQARHRQFQLPPPVFEVNQYSAWARMLGSVRGRPTSLKLPIQKATIRWLLAWRPATLAGHHARLLTCVATLACMRVNEVCRLQVCNLCVGGGRLPDVLWRAGLRGHVFGAHRPEEERYGAQGPLPRTWQLKGSVPLHRHAAAAVTGLYVRKDCPKRARPAARCSCPPLFPSTRCAKGGVTVATDRPPSRQQASDWIRWPVTQVGGESHRFSGISLCLQGRHLRCDRRGR